VSFKKPDDTDTIVNNTKGFTDESRDIYERNKHRLTNLYIDTQNPVGSLSTSINVPESQRAFVQVVTETVYFAEKLHLTEKVFKPIVCKQPFLLLAARGNLAYFRDYGFKTFGEFWDESYDDISDPGQRVQAVVDIIDGLSKIPRDELIDMKKSMIPILEHNFNHFYYEFKDIISREFEDNIKAAFASTSIKVPPERWDRLAKALRF
jgi:hypothetical protein